MKERPILFSGPMVRAILEGRKTQTRRVVKNAHILTGDDRTGVTDTPCSFGVHGDRLWVKERFRYQIDERPEVGLLDCIEYADGTLMKPDGLDEETGHAFDARCEANRKKQLWSTSIHMPRWASRITLEVVGVRVERVQDISEADAIAEGVETHAQKYGLEETKVRGMTPWYRYDGEPCAATSARHSFETLRESINGKGSWKANPWVWVVEFKRMGCAA